MGKTAVAKGVLRVSGWLTRVRTPQRTFRIVEFTEDGFVTEPSGRVWLPCRTSIWLLKLSSRLDEEHWDHWALKHDECDGVPCMACGGRICEPDD
jgi:hypothetical protein